MGVRLTEDDYDFLKYAKRIVARWTCWKRRYQSTFKKSFTVASHHYDFLSVHMATIAQRFQEDYPGVPASGDDDQADYGICGQL